MNQFEYLFILHKYTEVGRNYCEGFLYLRIYICMYICNVNLEYGTITKR
jgi:hypothetical protein